MNFSETAKALLSPPFRTWLQKLPLQLLREAVQPEQSEKKKRSSIKAAFIVQMPEIWDKEAPVYEAMVCDERFDTYLIIVPHYDYSELQFHPYGEEKEYFCSKYPDAKIILLTSIDEDVIDDSFDFVFYQRCWEMYLPEQLRCKNVIRYALTCYIPYCYHAAADPASYYQTDFFRYLSRFYCCSKDQCDTVHSIKGLEAVYLGYPVIDSLNYKDVPHKQHNILWTPRWADDSEYNGTSFNLNRERILELPGLSDNIRLTLRPHPLTFENALKQKWMTADEIEDYRRRAVAAGACFDDNKLIEDTFLDTDILITDFSSSIITFFLSGRPIIYCTAPFKEMTETFKDITDSLYIAQDWSSLLTILRELLGGYDPLYEKRQEVIRRINTSGSAVSNIIEDMVSFISYKH